MVNLCIFLIPFAKINRKGMKIKNLIILNTFPNSKNGSDMFPVPSCKRSNGCPNLGTGTSLGLRINKAIDISKLDKKVKIKKKEVLFTFRSYNKTYIKINEDIAKAISPKFIPNKFSVPYGLNVTSQKKA